MQSETSNHIPCDDIFGETPVGVRKTVSMVVFCGIFYLLVLFFLIVDCMHCNAAFILSNLIEYVPS